MSVIPILGEKQLTEEEIRNENIKTAGIVLTSIGGAILVIYAVVFSSPFLYLYIKQKKNYSFEMAGTYHGPDIGTILIGILLLATLMFVAGVALLISHAILIRK